MKGAPLALVAREGSGPTSWKAREDDHILGLVDIDDEVVTNDL